MALSSFLPWSLSLSRHHTGVGPGKNPTIQQGWEERIPPITTYSYWNFFLICVCIFGFRRDGSAGVLSENSTNKDYLAISNFYLFNSPFLQDDATPTNAFYHNKKKNLDLNNPFYRPFVFKSCWDQISRTCHVFTRLFTLNTPRYFLDFASQ